MWFTLQTLTTTGYGSLKPERWTVGLKWVSIAMMIAAIPIWASAIVVIGKWVGGSLFNDSHSD